MDKLSLNPIIDAIDDFYRVRALNQSTQFDMCSKCDKKNSDTCNTCKTRGSETSVEWNGGQKPTDYVPKSGYYALHFSTTNYTLIYGVKNPSKIYKDVDLEKFINVVKSFYPKD